jgi:phosphatidylglycerophosphate synthase
MLDGALKRRLDPALDAAGAALAARGVSANSVTLAALVLGLSAAGLIVAGQTAAALAVLLASRLLDGLDGAVARHTRPTDFGGFLDIVLDFVFYGAIPLAFVILDPVANGVAGAALIFSFYVNGASFLAYAVVAEKRGLSSEARGKKSIYFTTGLAEAAETSAAFAIMCLWPEWFPLVAWVFAGICLYTALARVMLARAVFRDDPSDL